MNYLDAAKNQMEEWSVTNNATAADFATGAQVYALIAIAERLDKLLEWLELDAHNTDALERRKTE